MAYRLSMMPLACMGLAWLNNKNINAFLKWLGKYSLEIYVMQMLLISIVEKLFKENITINSLVPQTLLTFGIVLCSCAPIHKVINELIDMIKLEK